MQNFILLLLAVLSLSKTPLTKPKLIASYRTEIITVVPKIEFVGGNVKNRKDSLLEEFSKDFFENLKGNKMTVISLDSVFAYKDSALIISHPADAFIQNSDNMRFNVNGSKAVLKGDKFYNFSRGYLEAWEDNREKFYRTGKAETLLNRETVIYENREGNIKIWVDSTLSPFLNPGVQIFGQLGGILKFEIRDSVRQVSSIIQSLKITEQ